MEKTKETLTHLTQPKKDCNCKKKNRPKPIAKDGPLFEVGDDVTIQYKKTLYDGTILEYKRMVGPKKYVFFGKRLAKFYYNIYIYNPELGENIIPEERIIKKINPLQQTSK